MTSAGADDDSTMGKAESLIPSCPLSMLLNSSLCDMVHTSSFPSRSYVMSFKRLSNVECMSVDWLLEAAP
ncbi:hypothetical protein OXX69_009423 [Metschnikowia pulcherrima]